MPSRLLRSLVLSALVCSTALAAPASAAPASTSRLLVVFKPNADTAAALKAVSAAGGSVRFQYSHVFSGAAIDLPTSALSGFSRNPNVASVESDGPVVALETQPTPPSWGLDRIDQRSLPLSGSYTYAKTGVGIPVYVVDTGLRASHVEFTGRTAPGYTSIADGRGTDDCNGHGTHVAGTVAGSTVGVAKQATIIPVRVLDCAGSGSWSGVIAGLDWVAAQHAAGTPAVANLSLGGGANSTVDAAVANLVADGVVVSVAAGNSNVDACTASPARVSSALTVGATTSTDARASYANFGACLDLFAPGSSIVSSYYTDDTSRASLSGTSMAAPHVAGAAALVLSTNPALSPSEVAARLVGGSTLGSVSSAGTNSPNRLLYIDPVSITAPATAPLAPQNVKATAGRRSAAVSWQQGSNGGSPLTSQTIHVYSGSTKVGSVQVSPTATSATVSGLTAGVSYSFSVSSTNSVGSSPESTRSNIITPKR